jgi:hypothetical protein
MEILDAWLLDNQEAKTVNEEMNYNILLEREGKFMYF